MDQDLSRTRRALHAVAELVIAGPQYAACGDIRLRAFDAGFRGWVTEVGVAGADLVTPAGPVPLRGTVGEVAGRAGITPRALRDVYTGGPEFSVDESAEVDAASARVLLASIVDGNAALLAFAPAEEPVLWPEHFDIGITVDEVNYGVSPGDAGIEEPYAYVGPWQVPDGPFWNQPFGAARPLTELPTPKDIVEFFRAGRDAVRAGKVGVTDGARPT